MGKLIVFVVGCPGVGKTTLVRGLLGPDTTVGPEWTTAGAIAALGPYTGKVLDGPDQLSRFVTAAGALGRLTATHPQWSVALLDGVRFGLHDVEAARAHGRVSGLHLVAPRPIISERRIARGSKPASAAFLDQHTSRAQLMARATQAPTLDAQGLITDVLTEARAHIVAAMAEAQRVQCNKLQHDALRM